MPTSFHSQIGTIIDLILRINPKAILDIGVGFGKYGFLSREYLEVAKGDFEKFNLTIDGIEGFAKYLNPAHKFIYNKIYLGNALDILPSLKKKYDLILIIDCLEHFDQQSGLKLLKLMQSRAKNIIISVPAFFIPQGSVNENTYEEHKYFWRKQDFHALKNKVFFEHFESLIVYQGEHCRKLRKKAFIYALDNLFPKIRVRIYQFLSRIKK